MIRRWWYRSRVPGICSAIFRQYRCCSASSLRGRARNGFHSKPPNLLTGGGLIAFLTNTTDICRARGIAEDRAGLPAGLRRLLELAEAVPGKKSARSETARISFFERVGNMTLGYGLRRVIELNQHRDSASTDSNAASASRRYAELIKTCSL
jgi:hypothetical protein